MTSYDLDLKLDSSRHEYVEGFPIWHWPFYFINIVLWKSRLSESVHTFSLLWICLFCFDNTCAYTNNIIDSTILTFVIISSGKSTVSLKVMDTVKDARWFWKYSSSLIINQIVYTHCILSKFSVSFLHLNRESGIQSKFVINSLTRN